MPENKSVIENIELVNNAIEYEKDKQTRSMTSNKKTNDSSSTLSRKPCIYKQVMNNEEMRACGINPPTTK